MLSLRPEWQSLYAFHALHIDESVQGDTSRRCHFNFELRKFLSDLQSAGHIPDRARVEAWCNRSSWKILFGTEDSGACNPHNVISAIMGMETTSQIAASEMSKDASGFGLLSVQGIIFDADLSAQEIQLLDCALRPEHLPAHEARLINLARIPHFKDTRQKEIDQSVMAARLTAKLRVIAAAEERGLAKFSRLDKWLTRTRCWLASF